MITPEWQEIKAPLEGIEPTRISSHRVSSLSPYEFPRALRTISSPNDRSIKIEFRYIEDEAAQPKFIGKNVTAWIGKTSKRIRGIRIKNNFPNEINSDDLDSAINDLVDKLSPAESQTESNYRVVGRVAKAKLAELRQ